MKLIIFFAVISALSADVSGQNEDWKKLYDENGIEFSYLKTECHDIQNGIHEEYFLVRITNKSDYPVSIKWNYNLWNNDNCYNCKGDNSDIKSYSIKINAGESIVGKCEDKSVKGLHVFSRFLNYKTKNPVTRFTVENVEVNFENL